jgi:putative SOS response-associated peptidase YedK
MCGRIVQASDPLRLAIVDGLDVPDSCAKPPLILPKVAYERWLGLEPDPHDLLVPFPAEQMATWPVSTRVNNPDNDDASLLDPAA